MEKAYSLSHETNFNRRPSEQSDIDQVTEAQHKAMEPQAHLSRMMATLKRLGEGIERMQGSTYAVRVDTPEDGMTWRPAVSAVKVTIGPMAADEETSNCEESNAGRRPKIEHSREQPSCGEVQALTKEGRGLEGAKEEAAVQPTRVKYKLASRAEPTQTKGRRPSADDVKQLDRGAAVQAINNRKRWLPPDGPGEARSRDETVWMLPAPGNDSVKKKFRFRF